MTMLTRYRLFRRLGLRRDLAFMLAYPRTCYWLSVGTVFTLITVLAKLELHP